MMSYVARSSNLSPHLRVITQSVASQVVPLLPPVIPVAAEKRLERPELHTQQSLNGIVPNRSTGTRIVSGPADIQVPDFSYYRRKSVMDPNSKSKDTADSRRVFSYMIVAAGGVATVYSAKAAVISFVDVLNPAADVLALAKVEVKLSSVPEGKSVTIKWRGKPLFVRHRTPEEIQAEQKVDVASLRDPQHDSERSSRPEWLIVIGVCTHLGCVPIANAGDYNGYYCPCHGSHYDASGRIRRGPAPLNLEVPPHEFVSDDLVVVG